MNGYNFLHSDSNTYAGRVGMYVKQKYALTPVDNIILIWKAAKTYGLN